MKKSVLLIILLSQLLVSFSQSDLEYTFDQARVLLAQRKIDEALLSLRTIYIEEPDNANINFLMGAAYTELPGTQEEAMFHLSKALKNVDENYKVGSFEEKAAPIHVYYYMSVALVELDKCVEANKAFEEFKKYANKVDQYYIDEVDRHMQKCPFDKKEKAEEWDKVVKAPLDYNPTYIPPTKPLKVDSFQLDTAGLVTQKLEYTTNAPLYGVQIGSNLNPSPTSTYSNVKNVDVFIDSAGIIRYVIGHLAYYKQAETLLKTIKEKGFNDAFIVNVNDERKYRNEVISYKNVNLRHGIRGTIEYYVQLGAFEDSIPQELTEIYLTINGIAEYNREGKTIIAIGPFAKYTEAINNKDKMIGKGIKDAFVVAYNRGKRIPLKEAIDYTDGKINVKGE